MKTCGTVIKKGTLDYLAPEIALELSQATEKSDLWALGCTIAETFTGSLTFEAKNLVDLTKKFICREEPNLGRRKFPIQTYDLIKKCFEYDKDQRPTAGELYDHFKELVS